MIQVFNCEQGTDEWRRARAGIPTASEFHTVLATGRGGAESKTRRTYMLKLIGERLTGEPAENFTNAHMERGHTMEDEARKAYCLLRDMDVQRVGFIRNGDAGASPDSLVSDAGMLEVKTKLPHLQLDVILQNRLPPEHVAQCQGALMIAEREWLDFVSYWPRLPLFHIRVYRDEPYIARLRVELADFNSELLTMMERFK